MEKHCFLVLSDYYHLLRRWKQEYAPRQPDFMPEDTKAGMVQAYLDSYTGDTVCSKQLYKEALKTTPLTSQSNGKSGKSTRL